MKPKNTLLLGALSVIVGSALPWGVFISGLTGRIAMSGLRGDGVITIIIGVLLLLGALTVKERPGKVVSWASAVVSAIAALLVLNVIIGIGGIANDVAITSVGIGPWVVLIGAALCVYGGLQKWPEAEGVVVEKEGAAEAETQSGTEDTA